MVRPAVEAYGGLVFVVIVVGRWTGGPVGTGPKWTLIAHEPQPRELVNGLQLPHRKSNFTSGPENDKMS